MHDKENIDRLVNWLKMVLMKIFKSFRPLTFRKPFLRTLFLTNIYVNGYSALSLSERDPIVTVP